MIKLLKFPILFLISVVIQTTLISWIRVFDIGPDFILIFVLEFIKSLGKSFYFSRKYVKI